MTLHGLTCYLDSTARAWDMKVCTIAICQFVTGFQSGECVQVYKGHTNDVTGIQVVQRTLYTSSRDNTIKSWDIEKVRCIFDLIYHYFVTTCREWYYKSLRDIQTGLNALKWLATFYIQLHLIRQQELGMLM
jgi:WD40 repeat protein